MAIIFKIGSIDYSNHVVAENYNVNYEPVYREWVDGAQVKHRDIIGQKVRGSFDMYCTKLILERFVHDVDDAKNSNNATHVFLLVNNTDDVDTLVETYVFIDFKPVRRNTTGTEKFDVFEVTIEEP